MTAPLPTASRWNTYRRSKYPKLWDGCVGAWCPSLGVTGARLHDYSQRMAWATPTAYGATNWAVERGGYAYDFKSGEYATTGVNGPTGDRAVSLWYRSYYTFTAIEQYDIFLSFGQNSTDQNFSIGKAALSAWGGPTVPRIFVTQNGNSISVTQTDNLWHHVCATNTGSTWSLFIDGALVETKSMNTTNTAGPIMISAYPGAALVSSGHYTDDIRVYSRVLHPEEIRLLATRRAIAYEPVYRPAYYTETDAGGGGVAKPVLFHSYYMSQGMRP